MQLLVVRHAPAGDKIEFAQTGRPDAERAPLGPEGISQPSAAGALETI